MKKNDLVNAIANKTGITKKSAEAVINAFTSSIEEALIKGDKVALMGFGTFEVRERSAREGINPATKAKIKIAASKAPAFKAGKALKDAVK